MTVKDMVRYADRLRLLMPSRLPHLTQSVFGPMTECIACGSKEIVNLGKPRLQFTNTSYHVLECSKCGL